MRLTPGTSVRHSWLAWMVLLCGGAGAAPAATPDAESAGWRARPIAVQIEQLHTLRVTTSGRVIENSVRRIQGSCPQEVSSHTDADFMGGAFMVQAGFAEGETASSSYVLSSSDFPLRIDFMEMIFATAATRTSTATASLGQWTWRWCWASGGRVSKSAECGVRSAENCGLRNEKHSGRTRWRALPSI